ncbi:MAG: hypothetical protein MMC33_008718 [Icmadophila ericetorum]|nr:hypothetical protein [Icmadophila ericetorum]
MDGYVPKSTAPFTSPISITLMTVPACAITATITASATATDSVLRAAERSAGITETGAWGTIALAALTFIGLKEKEKAKGEWEKEKKDLEEALNKAISITISNIKKDVNEDVEGLRQKVKTVEDELAIKSPLP